MTVDEDHNAVRELSYLFARLYDMLIQCSSLGVVVVESKPIARGRKFAV